MHIFPWFSNLSRLLRNPLYTVCSGQRRVNTVKCIASVCFTFFNLNKCVSFLFCLKYRKMVCFIVNVTFCLDQNVCWLHTLPIVAMWFLAENLKCFLNFSCVPGSREFWFDIYVLVFTKGWRRDYKFIFYFITLQEEADAYIFFLEKHDMYTSYFSWKTAFIKHPKYKQTQ